MPSSLTNVAVVGATGAVGGVLRSILRERGIEGVRYFASARSAGSQLDGILVEEATPEALAGADVEIAFFAVGATASRHRRRPRGRRFGRPPRTTIASAVSTVIGSFPACPRASV